MGSRPRWLTPRAGLAIIIIGASLLAATWTFLVPIFQNPDEPQHLDYALSIASAGHLLNARERPTIPNHWTLVVHPDTRYLMQVTEWERVYANHAERMPNGYGSITYYQQLDRGAPQNALNGPPAKNPGLLAVYPFGYYALLGAWLWLVGHLTSSLTVLVFTARLLSVFMLPVTLLLCYAIGRELRMSPRMALFLTAVIGLFPLTSFVASTIQPDNLSFLLVSLATYLALLARRRRQPLWLLAALGVAMGFLLVTKFQFYVCLAVPVVATLLLDRRHQQPRTPLLPTGVFLAAPSLALLGVHLWVVWGTITPIPPTWTALPNTADFHAAAQLGVLPFAGYVLGAVVRAAYTYYLGGQGFRTFWGTVGWLENPVQFGPPVVYFILRAIEVAWTVAVVELMFLYLWGIGRRLARVARRGHAWIALRLAFQDPLLIAYLLFAVFMFMSFVVTDGTFQPQGRNWFPFLLATWMLAFRYAPRALSWRRPALGATFPIATAAALLLFCLVGSAFAILTIEHRFYAVMPAFFG